jgi:Flp pilus assembly protein TadG
MNRPCIPAASRKQRGAYAIEFAVVFMLLFGLLYAIICYGLIFALRLGLQNAAEDGARAALRYQTSFADRELEAKKVATRQSDWLPASLITARNVDAQICQVVGNVCPAPACDTWNARCQMIVTITVSDMQLLLPPLPAFAAPTQIAGRASMLLSGRSP